LYIVNKVGKGCFLKKIAFFLRVEDLCAFYHWS